MSTIELRLLGDLEVIRDGVVMPLPPSRKTRALLAYLALNPRPFRREHLCELLWEIPDDPRGALRWSLSKLRRLLDDTDRARVVADRAHVAVDTSDLDIDVTALYALADDGLADAPVSKLEAMAERCRGNLLEGLELANYPDYNAWCIAEREHAARAHAQVLSTLVARLPPERALPHARRLAAVDPYDEPTRAALIRLLVALGHTEEAQQQYRIGVRMLQEVGAAPSPELHEAWRGPPGSRIRPDGASARLPPVSERRAVDPLPAAPAATPLIGRDAETAHLDAALATVTQQGQAQVVLVVGEPGIGKSRLLDTVAQHAGAADVLLLQASAFESESIRPFALWIDALRRLDPDTAPDVFGTPDHHNRDRLFGALSDFVARAAGSGAVVLVFDDLQWCDESSAAALHYVLRMNRQRPLLVVLAARVDEVRDNTAVQQALRGLRRDGILAEITLGPLPEEDVRRLIAERAPKVDHIRLSRECGGNPLLAIELARAEAIGDSGGSLNDLVRERLSRLGPDSADVLRWAALLAPRIEVSWLARVIGTDGSRVAAALEQGERHALLQAGERGFRFSHDLVARSIYDDIAVLRRRVMHRRAAELLEQDTALDLDHAVDLAHHAGQSGDPALAARSMVSAGRLCLRFFANDDALALARSGLEWAARLSGADQVCLSLELHDIILAAAPLDDWNARAAQYVALAEQALDHGALWHARLGYHMASYLRWANGQWASAREESLQAERAARSGSDEDQIIGMAETAKCLAMLERDLTRADALLMEAKSLAERRRITHIAIPAALGMLRFHENRLDEAEELFQETRTLCKSAGDRLNEFQANEYLVMIDIERDRFDAACARCAVLVDLGAKLREGSEAPFARALQGLCQYALNDDDGALDAAIGALRIADAKHRLAYVLTRTALLDIDRGRHDTARARAHEALACAEALQRATEMLLAHAVLAQAHAATGDTHAHRRHIAAIAALDNAPVARWARDRAAALAPKRHTD